MIQGVSTVVYGVKIPYKTLPRLLNDLGILDIPSEYQKADYLFYICTDDDGNIYEDAKILKEKWKKMQKTDIHVKNTTYTYEVCGYGYEYREGIAYYISLKCDQLDDPNKIGEMDIDPIDIIKFNEWAEKTVPYLEKPKFYFHIY